MEDYFCHQCSALLGHLNPVPNVNFTGSSYQLRKFIKHTIPTHQKGLVSVFDNGSYTAYENYIVSASLSGSTEFNSKHQKNIIWYANKDIGISYLNGVSANTANVVKVVLTHDTQLIHAYPIEADQLLFKKCSICQRDVIV